MYTKLTLISGLALAINGYRLVNIFPDNKKISNNIYLKFAGALSGLALVLLIGFTQTVIRSISKSYNGVELSVGYLYPVYAFFVAFYIFYSVYILAIKNKRSSGITKVQIKYFAFGLVTYAVFAAASNLLIPVLIDSWAPSKYGPLFALIFVGYISYAIIKHRLLDIRLIVAKVIVYLTILLTTTFIIVAGLFLLSTLILENSRIEPEKELLYITFSIIIAVILQPLKNYFDKISNKIFYRDTYDSQLELSTFGQNLVLNNNFNSAAKSFHTLLNRTIKPQTLCILAVDTFNDDKVKVYTGENVKLSPKEDFDYYLKSEEKLILVDEQPLDSSNYTILKNSNVDVVAKLYTNGRASGVVMLGAKKSGAIYSEQDVGFLLAACNEFSLALENTNRFEEISNFNDTLRKKIEAATSELRRSNQKLKALDQAKDDFISMASHQLRTPLTTAKGYVSMVLDGDAGEITKPQREMLDQAYASSQRMVYLISDLLNVSRLRTGKFIIEYKPVYLPDVVEQEVQQLADSAAGKSLELVFEKPAKFPTIELDETKIRQVIMNFIDNAIYYTPAGGRITVRLIENGKSVEYRVEDNGIGVPKREQHHLFSKFYRAGNARKARPDGTGLGLFMAKKVIIAQGGALIFKSKENEGSTFGFTFPKDHIKPLVTTVTDDD